MTGSSAATSPVTVVGPGTVVTAFSEPRIIADGAVAWRGDRILEVGSAVELCQRYPEARRIDARGGLILPGLVNLHHHFYSSLARGLNPGLPLRDFGEVLDGLWWRLDRALEFEDVRISAELALADCIAWGTTTVFDHHASPSCIRGSLQVIGEAIDRAGLSGVLCYEISDRNGHDQAVEGLEENLEFFRARRTDPRVRGMFGLHASFTVDDTTLSAVADRRLDGMGCHVHVAEAALDETVSRVVHGAAPVARLDRYGLLDDRSLAIHGIHLGSDDRRLLARRGAIIVHNPESNANNGVGSLDLEGAAADGCRIGLGTDGMSSAMLPALRAAFLGQRAAWRDPTRGFTVAPQLLAVNAEFAGRLLNEPRLGRIEAGAPADLCILDAAPPTEVNPDTIFAQLVYGSALSPVRHTVARGRCLLEDHRFTTLDPTECAAEARRAAPALWRRFHALSPSRPVWLPSED